MNTESLGDYAKYDSYKDSGIDWLGKVPEKWVVFPLNAISTLKSISGYPDEDLLSVYLNKGVIKFDDVKEKRTNVTSLSLDNYQLVDEGDFVLNNQQAWRGSVGVSSYRGVISPAYIVLELSQKLISSFANYMFRSEHMIYQYVIHSKGVGTIQRNLYWQSFKNSVCLIPPIEEQIGIANFLDQKINQLNQAIDLKQQQIERLNEYKQIVIQNAVTKGLNPDAKMKDSGIDWMGDIPEHWEVISLRYLFDFLNKDRVPISADERGGMQGIYPYYGASGIIDYVNDYIFDEKLILIAEDGANLLSKSTPLAFIAEGKYWVNNHAHILKPKYEGFDFWAKLLSLCDYTIYITGAAQPKLSRGNLGNVLLPVPPAEEILAISKKLEKDLPIYFDATQRFEAQIERLKEYKTILINQAVTGKIKVS